MTMKTTIDMEKKWEEKEQVFDISVYEYGFPCYEDGIWKIHPWTPENIPCGDIGFFAKRAAKTLYELNNTYPLDICAFALYLRRCYVLETLGFNITKESLNILIGLEMVVAEKYEHPMCIVANDLVESCINMIINLEKQQFVKGDKEEVEKFKQYCNDVFIQKRNPFEDMAILQAKFPSLVFSSIKNIQEVVR